MSGMNEDRERQVVPRWRSFNSTLRRRELMPLSLADRLPVSGHVIDKLAEDWKQTPDISVAADFVCAAFVLGQGSIAADAAEFLLSKRSAPQAARSICEAYLGRTTPEPVAEGGLVNCGPEAEPAPASVFTPWLHIGIHQARRQLEQYPRNPILWSNLARLYTSVGIQEKAWRAMRVALAMAPENRFILRGASRMFLHNGDPERAHRLLARSSNLTKDPWILASEIAVAAANRRTSRFIKKARHILDAEKHAPFHVSELASALGTLEALAGNLKTGRKLIRISLKQPSENSIAQAGWLARRTGIIAMTETRPADSFEANAWFAFRSANWKLALSEAGNWLNDQPFSSRPAVFGSHIASSVILDYPQAIRFARQGLLSNPDDLIIHNNLAFALALNGDVQEAEKVLARVDLTGASQALRVVVTATNGLIAFRMGRPDVGRQLYEMAITLAEVIKDPREAIARIYLALEELRIFGPNAERRRREALEHTKNLTEPWQLALIERLKQQGA